MNGRAAAADGLCRVTSILRRKESEEPDLVAIASGSEESYRRQLCYRYRYFTKVALRIRSIYTRKLHRNSYIDYDKVLSCPSERWNRTSVDISLKSRQLGSSWAQSSPPRCSE